MSITDLLVSHCNQTAVYWGNPINDGRNNFTYDDPIEIQCRWEDKIQIFKGLDAKGSEIIFSGVIFPLQDLDENGCLFLGTLDDLNSDAYEDPLNQDGVYSIKQWEKLPALNSTTEFLRKAYLSPYRYR